MSLFGKILAKAIPLPKLIAFDRYLFIGPHPDDIEIGAGSTALSLASAGKIVKFLVCTDGRYGIEDRNITIDEVIATRKAEATAAAANMGINDIQFLPFPDGGDYKREDMTKEIVKVICEFRPDIIFAPDSKLISELHLDHINTGEAASAAFIISGIGRQAADMGLNKHQAAGIAYYYTDRPNTFVKTKGLFEKQFQSVLLHRSQFPDDTEQGKFNIKYLKLYLNIRSIRFGLRRLKGRAEGFRVLGALNAHCAPESTEY